MHSRANFSQQVGAPTADANVNDGFPRLRGERGFIPLRPEVSEQYEQFWAKNVEHITRITAPYKGEYERWPDDWYHNMWFDTGDAELYYSMIRTHKPSRIIEIGSGYCTRIAAEACRVNGTGRITCIDPIPRKDLPAIVDFEKAFVQDIDLGFFDALGENDFLFIDSSHEAEEAIYHYLILDRLAPGVIVHHHDFMFPLLPDWPEENVIISYYMNHPNEWEGIASNADARHKMGPDGYGALFGHYASNPHRYAGSIYTRKRAKAAGADYRSLMSDHKRTTEYAARVTEEYERVREYAAHVTEEYDRLHARWLELERIVSQPRLTARAFVSGLLGGLSRRVGP